MTRTSFPKNRINILLLENISPEALRILQSAGYERIRTLNKALTEEELLKEIKDVHVLGIRSKTNITRKVLEGAPRLLAVGCFCIGTNQVDLEAATDHGIAVFNAPYSNTRSVAELTIGAAIMLIRKVIDKNRLAHEGVWMKEAKNCFELRGKTLGIIGYGNIGSQVSVLAESMGLKVIFYDLEKKLPLGNASAVTSLQELLSLSDIVTIHVPGTPATQNLINRDTLSFCKPGVILINYARGELVDLEDLRAAVTEGKVAGVALDVFPMEPEKNGDAFDCSLRNLPNVLLTPHIGGSTEEAQANIGTDVSEKMVQFIETGSTYGSQTIPALTQPVVPGTHRLLHIHRNIPGVLSSINTELSQKGINIVSQQLRTNEHIGYVVLDINKELSKEAAELLKDVNGTIKVRLLY